MVQRKDKTSVWDIGNLPFVYSAGSSPSNDGLPDTLPFVLGVDKRTGHLMEMPDSAVSEALEKAYSSGSMLTGYMDEHGIGRSYADDFLNYICCSLSTERLDGVRVLEVGCGTGYLLSRLKELGADVIGIEPGPQADSARRRFNIPIIRDFFPTKKISGRFDVVIAYAVIEHIPDAVSFLELLANYLAPGGVVVACVPDCTPCIEKGDISILMHEHWNYFTAEALVAALGAGGYGDIQVEKGGFGGTLYAKAVFSGIKGDSVCSINNSVENFVELSMGNISKLKYYLIDAEKRNEIVGIYCPARAINALHLIKSEIVTPTLRFFDDNPTLQGLFYPGFPYIVESRESLFRSKVDRLLVFSWTFGKKIADELSGPLGSDVCIDTCGELFS